MDVVALVPSREHASTRYRILQFQQMLASAGMTLRLEPIAANIGPRLLQLTRCRHSQVVFLQRKLLPVWQIALLRASSKMLVYDFDDAVYLRDSFHPNGPNSLTRMLRFQAIVGMSDYVIAGNKYLADAALKYSRRAVIDVIPTCLDSKRYETANHGDRLPTRLVWIGSSSTLRSLDRARNILEAIGQAIPNTVLRVICDKFPKFQHLRVEPAPWSTATETSDLRAADIGISWVPDDRWSMGKCGLKVLQYMAAGLPVLASPVGVHREMLSDGPGFLPTSVNDWVRSAQHLVTNHALRAEMGRSARRQLESNFDVQTWGPVLVDRLREAASRL